MAAATALLAATAAEAKPGVTKLDGRTSQGRDFKLALDRKGKLLESYIEWRADCNNGQFLQTFGYNYPPLDRNSRSGFRDKFTEQRKRVEGYDIKYKSLIIGRRTGERSFEGIFKATADIDLPSGEDLTKCRTGTIKWTAGKKR